MPPSGSRASPAAGIYQNAPLCVSDQRGVLLFSQGASPRPR